MVIIGRIGLKILLFINGLFGLGLMIMVGWMCRFDVL